FAIGCSAEAPPSPASEAVASTTQDAHAHWGHHFCGGTTGHECSADEVCVSFLSRSCPGPNAVGLCLPRPHHCSSEVDSVCGCDGATYDNLCEAAESGTTLAHHGSCAPGPSCDGTHQCPGLGTC